MRMCIVYRYLYKKKEFRDSTSLLVYDKWSWYSVLNEVFNNLIFNKLIRTLPKEMEEYLLHISLQRIFLI